METEQPGLLDFDEDDSDDDEGSQGSLPSDDGALSRAADPGSRSRTSRTQTAATRPHTSMSDESEGPPEQGSTRYYIEEIEAALAEGNAKEASKLVVEAIRDHPRNTALQRLSVETSNLVKWYPRFYDALVRVSLTGPTSLVIGNTLSVRYEYSHKQPSTAFKEFLPLARFVDKQVSRYNERMMRNSKLSSDRVANIVATSLNVDKSDVNSITESQAGRGEKAPSKHEWSDEELDLLRSLVDVNQKDRLKDVVETALYRIKEDLQIERQPWEVREMVKSIRLYKEVKMLDHVHLADSEQVHHEKDWVGLFLKPSDEVAAPPVTLFERLLSAPKPKRQPQKHAIPKPFTTSTNRAKSDSPNTKPNTAESSRSDISEGDDIDETEKGLLLRLEVPAGNVGELDFSHAVLPIGNFEFRYYMKGSTTPACISQIFSTCMPIATLSVPNEPVICGDPFKVGYAVELSREHSALDWIEIVQLDGYGPLGTAYKVSVPEGNEGDVHLPRSPIFPGSYHAVYHLGNHGGMVAATSARFEVAIKESSGRETTREIRVFLCSSVADMHKERSAVLNKVLPVLQARLESRFLTISIVPMSMGVTEDGGTATEEETANLEHLRLSLREVERCRPFFVAVLGERYGWIPDSYDADLVDTYPWLAANRNDNMLLAGVRISAVEIQILNGFLIQPAKAMHHAFFFRDPDYVRRSDVPARSRGKYEPLSEFGREAVNQLKDEIRRVPGAKLMAFHGEEVLTSAMIDHLSDAIDHEFPRNRVVTTLERMALVTDRIYADMLTDLLEHHPTFDNVPLSTDVVFSSRVPVFLQASAGCGKSALIAISLRRFLADLRADSSVEWGGSPSELGEGASATSFVKDGVKHALLVQHIGSDSTVTTEAEVLEQAMEFTSSVFGLRGVVAWDEDELVKAVPNWLEQVNARGVFIWILDGIDQIMGLNPVESTVTKQSVHAIIDKNATSALRNSHHLTHHRKDGHEVLEALEQREREKLHSARQHAQHKLRRWLVPLLDEASPHYAPTAYPNLRILVSADPEGSDGLRPIDSHIHSLLQSTLGSLRILEIPFWLVDQRKEFVRARVEAARAGIDPAALEEGSDFLLLEVKPVTVGAGEAEQADPNAKDVFANVLHSQSVIMEVLDACCTLTSTDERKARFKAFKGCNSLEKLALKIVKVKADSHPGAADFLRFLYLVRTGLREAELLLLMRGRQWISGEDLLDLIEWTQPVTCKIFGLITLTEPFKKACGSLFASAEARGDVLQDLAHFFEAMKNPERKAEELPLLLLRLGHTEALLEYITTQEAMSLLGKRDLLRYVKGANFPHEAVALCLKRQLEVAFCVEAPAGRKYDLSKLQSLEPLGSLGHGVPADDEGVTQDMLPSTQRAVMVQTRVRFFCKRVADVADIMCHMDATAMEVAEGLLEGVLKMLFGAEALAAICERETLYPSDALKMISAMVTLFTGGLRAMSGEGLQQTARQESLRQYHLGAVAELMLGKVHILSQTVARIQARSTNQVLWESQAVEGSLIRLQRRLTGADEDGDKSPKKRSPLQRKGTGLLRKDG